jgi:hypothetical protein
MVHHGDLWKITDYTKYKITILYMFPAKIGQDPEECYLSASGSQY